MQIENKKQNKNISINMCAAIEKRKLHTIFHFWFLTVEVSVFHSFLECTIRREICVIARWYAEQNYLYERKRTKKKTNNQTHRVEKRAKEIVQRNGI